MPDLYGWDSMANIQFFNLTSNQGGGVTDVTATPPITSSGGSTPDISTSMNTNRLIGRSSAGVGVMEEIEVGDGLELVGGVLSNTATPTPSGYYGAFQDNLTQSANANNVGVAMIFRQTDLSNGVSIVSNGTNLTRITFAHTGVYNIQFSSQFENTDNEIHKIAVWLKRNGNDVSGSTGFISIEARKNASVFANNIVSWNYLIEAVGGDYFELYWSTDDYVHVTMPYFPATAYAPLTPSVILTATQQSGIMAGTGITALNGLTSDVQTFGTGTSGTDFNIVSSGSTHTFNIPSASNLARGLVSIIAQTFAGVKTFLSAPIFDSLTASQILATDGSKAVQSLDTATYPSLTELSYVKGVTSAIQTQINSRLINQIWNFQTANVINASTTTWIGVGVTAGSNESTSTVIIPHAMTLTNMYLLHYSGTQPASGSQVITIRKNGVDTLLAITIAAGAVTSATPYSNTSNPVSFVAGDRLSIRRVNNAAGSGGAFNGLSFTISV
jgi:hypothetical protein